MKFAGIGYLGIGVAVVAITAVAWRVQTDIARIRAHANIRSSKPTSTALDNAVAYVLYHWVDSHSPDDSMIDVSGVGTPRAVEEDRAEEWLRDFASKSHRAGSHHAGEESQKRSPLEPHCPSEVTVIPCFDEAELEASRAESLESSGPDRPIYQLVLSTRDGRLRLRGYVCASRTKLVDMEWDISGQPMQRVVLPSKR